MHPSRIKAGGQVGGGEVYGRYRTKWGKCATIVNIRGAGEPSVQSNLPRHMKGQAQELHRAPPPPPPPSSPVLLWPYIKVISHPPLSCCSHALTTTPPRGFLSACVCLFQLICFVCVCACVHMLMSGLFYANAHLLFYCLCLRNIHWEVCFASQCCILLCCSAPVSL